MVTIDVTAAVTSRMKYSLFKLPSWQGRGTTQKRRISQ